MPAGTGSKEDREAEELDADESRGLGRHRWQSGCSCAREIVERAVLRQDQRQTEAKVACAILDLVVTVRRRQCFETQDRLA